MGVVVSAFVRLTGVPRSMPMSLVDGGSTPARASAAMWW